MERKPTTVTPLQLLDLHDDALFDICRRMHGVALHEISTCKWLTRGECRTCPTLLKAFSSTCKRLRSLAYPLLFRSCTFGVRCPMGSDQPSNLTLALGFAQRQLEATSRVREITFDARQLCEPVTSVHSQDAQIIDVAKDCARSLAYFKNLQTLRITVGKPLSPWLTYNTEYHLARIMEFEESFRHNCPQNSSMKTLILDRDPGTLLTAFPNINDLSIHGECDYDTGGSYVSPYFQQVRHPPRLQRLELLTTWSVPLLAKILAFIPTLRVLSMPAPALRYPAITRKFIDDFETFLGVLAKHSNLEILQMDRDIGIELHEDEDEDLGYRIRRVEDDTKLHKRIFDMCRSLKRVHFGDAFELWAQRNEAGEVEDVRIIYPPPPESTTGDILLLN